MGNGCVCSDYICYHDQDVKLDSLLEDHILNNKYNEQIEITNLYNIAKYFNEGEKEINMSNEKKKVKRILSHKKAKKIKSYNSKGDSKYELMLKRLLEQKNTEKKGIKKRTTIRTNNNGEVIQLIGEVLNKNNKVWNYNNRNHVVTKKKSSILLNQIDKNNIYQGRQSFKNIKFQHKKIRNNFINTEINDLYTLNEIKNLNNNNNSNYISDANYAC